MEPADATAFEGASGGMVSPVGGAGADEGTLYRFVVSRRTFFGGAVAVNCGRVLEVALRGEDKPNDCCGSGEFWRRIRARMGVLCAALARFGFVDSSGCMFTLFEPGR